MQMKKLACLIFIVFSIKLEAQSWQDTVQMIDKILEGYNGRHPGIQVAVSRGGELLYSGARGMSNLEYEIPLTTISRIEAGSVSKQFTAAAILLLEQQGKLSQEDDIRKYVPEVPDYGHTIRISHLMHHTSGIKDWGSIASLTGWPRSTKAYTNDDALAIIARQKTLNNIPGDEFIYSNSNYNLLAIIVQRASGKSLADFTREFIFEPAGMKHTSWRDDYQRIVKDRATAYSTDGIHFSTLMPNENAYGNGGLLTTAEDLMTWNQYYLSGKLGNPGLLSKQVATFALNNGVKNNYAAGLRIDENFGWQVISHTGATAGYRSSLKYYPELSLSIGWLSNNAGIGMSGIPDAIEHLLVPDKTIAENNNVQPQDTIQHQPTTPGILGEYVGKYYSDESEGTMIIEKGTDGLLIYPGRGTKDIYSQVSKDRFSYEENEIQFERNKKGKIAGFYISISRARKVKYTMLN